MPRRFSAVNTATAATAIPTLWVATKGTTEPRFATPEETGGDFFLSEFVGEKGKVTPMHVHPAAHETFYILDGEILLDIDGEKHSLSTGGVAVVPRGVPHAFMVTSPTMRSLTIQTPGTDEAFYRMASEPALPGSEPVPVDFDRIREAALRTGAIEIVGPPPFES